MTITNVTLQNHMLSIRAEMGYPLTAPACHTLSWSSGGPVDIQVGMDLARLAQIRSRDVIYGAWHALEHERPSEYVLALRQPHTVDIIRKCSFYAANETAPLNLMCEARDEHYVLNDRLFLERRSGMPGRRLELGKRRAEERIILSPHARLDEMLDGGGIMPRGGEYMPTYAEPSETVVIQFS